MCKAWMGLVACMLVLAFVCHPADAISDAMSALDATETTDAAESLNSADAADAMDWSRQRGPAGLGAYIGCFNLAKLLQADSGVKSQVAKQYTAGTISRCTVDCKARSYSMSIVTPDFKCRCAIATPDDEAQLPDVACGKTGTGAAIFYHHDLAGTQNCKLAPLHLSADSVDIHYNPQNVKFYKDNTTGCTSMRLMMEGKDGIRLAPKGSWQLHGQVEVTAKIDGASGAVTAFYLRSSDFYTRTNKENFDEVDFEWINGRPGIRNCVWLNTFNGGESGGEHMLRPRTYQKALGLDQNQTSENTYIKYTIHWQPSRVTWAMDGVPMHTKKAGQYVKWEDMMSKWFAMWSDDSKFQFGGKRNNKESPYFSYFHSLKRILCEGKAQPLPAALSWLTHPQVTVVSKPQKPATKTAGPGGKPQKPVATKPQPPPQKQGTGKAKVAPKPKSNVQGRKGL